VVRLAEKLHPYVAFGIMPLFALANAGVSLDAGGAAPGSLTAGIVAGLAIGKPLGVVATSLVAVKLGLCELPRGVDWRGLLVVGCVAGVGFTMALFIGDLAFKGHDALAPAKLAVLIASGVSAVVGLVAGRLLLPEQIAEGAATSATEAERSDDV
jgi:NhaA family Na+:H+ antiporter